MKCHYHANKHVTNSNTRLKQMPSIANQSISSNNSQVHYVQKKTFVQNSWRFANLYIFGKLIKPGVRKIMFTFAQPPLTLVAMATKIWEFQHKISCISDNIRDYNGASCIKVGVYKVRQFNGVIEILPRLTFVAMATKLWEF